MSLFCSTSMGPSLPTPLPTRSTCLLGFIPMSFADLYHIFCRKGSSCRACLRLWLDTPFLQAAHSSPSMEEVSVVPNIPLSAVRPGHSYGRIYCWGMVEDLVSCGGSNRQFHAQPVTKLWPNKGGSQITKSRSHVSYDGD